MLIICPSCISTYRLPDGAVRSGAAAVRCAQCGSVFSPAPRGAVLPVLSAPARAIAPIPPGLICQPALRPGIEFTADRAPVRRSRVAPVVTVAIALLGLNMATLAFRSRVAEMAPATAPLFAAVGLPVTPDLKLDAVETTVSDEDGNRVLAIQGRIANAGRADTDLPNLRIVIRDAAEQSVYSWTTAAPQPRLAPGAAVDFRSRLVAPPSTGHDVVVSFAGSSDSGSAVGSRNTP